MQVIADWLTIQMDNASGDKALSPPCYARGVGWRGYTSNQGHHPLAKLLTIKFK